ncbi:MAG: glycosyltransferase family 39 protein, partial [Hyphomicrobiales bacterium]
MARLEVKLAEAWIEQYGEETVHQTFLARLFVIPFAVLGTLLTYRIASSFLSGCWPLVPALLWAFSPTVLTYGCLATPDVASAFSLLLVCWRYYCWARAPTTDTSLAFGMAMGLALLVKSTWIMLLPL